MNLDDDDDDMDVDRPRRRRIAEATGTQVNEDEEVSESFFISFFVLLFLMKQSSYCSYTLSCDLFR
jgi:hypothetical protein